MTKPEPELEVGRVSTFGSSLGLFIQLGVKSKPNPQPHPSGSGQVWVRVCLGLVTRERNEAKIDRGFWDFDNI